MRFTFAPHLVLFQVPEAEVASLYRKRFQPFLSSETEAQIEKAKLIDSSMSSDPVFQRVCWMMGEKREKREGGMARRRRRRKDVAAPFSLLSSPHTRLSVQLVAMLPANVNGEMTFQAFLQVVKWWERAPLEHKLGRLFDMFDLDGDGTS